MASSTELHGIVYPKNCYYTQLVEQIVTQLVTKLVSQQLKSKINCQVL